jgi:hypothetical protein
MERRIKPVPVLLLDKERTFLCDVNALISLGEVLNLNMMTPEAWEEVFGKSWPAGSPEAQAFLQKYPENTPDEKGNVFIPATPSFHKVRAIVWALLLHEDEKLTLRQAGALIDPANLQAVVDAYIQAITISQGSPRQGETEKKEQAVAAE